MRRFGSAFTRGLAVGLYLTGLALLLLAWVFGNPPGASPDEPSHYVRALGAAAWDLTGHPGAYSAAAYPSADAAQLADLNDYARNYPVPAGLSPVTFGCNAGNSAAPAGCLSETRAMNPAEDELSMHAGQPPLPYLLAGPAMAQTSTPVQADWAGRTSLALWCLALIAVPLSLAGRYRARLLLGLTVALTPMAIFTGSILNPSGIEIFSSVGFFLSLFAVADGRYPRGALVAAGFTGVFVTMSRPFAPLWIVTGLISAAGLIGPGVLWQGIRRRPVGSGITTAAIGLSTGSTLVFLTLFTSPSATQPSVHLSWSDFKNIGTEAVGNFGWLDTPLPMHIDYRWLVVVTIVTVLGLIFGNWRERLTIAVTTGLSLGATYLISITFLLPLNVGPQGRHFLPILVLQPLSSVVVLGRQRLPIRLIAVGVPVVLMIGLQLESWVSNSFRQGLGKPVTTLGGFPGAVSQLFGNVAWSPPGGFPMWFEFVCLGCLLLVFASAQSVLVPEPATRATVFERPVVARPKHAAATLPKRAAAGLPGRVAASRPRLVSAVGPAAVPQWLSVSRPLVPKAVPAPVVELVPAFVGPPVEAAEVVRTPESPRWWIPERRDVRYPAVEGLRDK